MTMKGTLAVSLTGLQGMGWGPHEKPVDRVTAMAAMQNQRAHEAENAAAMRSLGQAIIAFKYSNRADMRDEAVQKLADQLHKIRKLEMRPGLRMKIAGWALQEHVIDMCPRCQGAKEVQMHADAEGYQPMMPCPPMPEGCSGTGKRRYSDAERIAATGAAHGDHFARAHEYITRAEHLADETAERMLGRRE